MFGLGSQAAQHAPEFVPPTEDRGWLAKQLFSLAERLGAPAAVPRVIVDPPGRVSPRDFDSLFDMICGVQELVGQGALDLTLVEVAPGEDPRVPAGFEALGDPRGQMLHTLHREGEYAVLYNPVAFRKSELLFASVAREVGRVAIHQNGGHAPDAKPDDIEAEAEIAGIALGLGVWIANGAYIFENGCCGGGCGIDLRSLRTGLSMPEAAFTTALDAQRKGLGRRVVAKHLAPTQKAAFKKSWSVVAKSDTRALAAAPTRAALG